MATMIETKRPAVSVGPIIYRGFEAAHGTLVGAFYLFLLHAPAQVLGAIAQMLQAGATGAPPAEPSPMQLLLNSLIFVLALAVFFLFPLVQGGILGQIRDRLATPQQPPGRFGAYGVAHYRRLLGSLAVFTLLVFIVMLPVMCYAVLMVFQALKLTVEAPAAPPPAAQQFTLQFASLGVVGVGLVILTLLTAAIGMIYWVANCILVSTPIGVFASWRQSLRFCRQNFAACALVCLLIVVVSVLIAPLGMAAQLGWVTNPWAGAAVALLYAALIGYIGVICASLVMSLYWARRAPADQPELQELQSCH